MSSDFVALGEYAPVDAALADGFGLDGAAREKLKPQFEQIALEFNARRKQGSPRRREIVRQLEDLSAAAKGLARAFDNMGADAREQLLGSSSYWGDEFSLADPQFAAAYADAFVPQLKQADAAEKSREAKSAERLAEVDARLREIGMVEQQAIGRGAPLDATLPHGLKAEQAALRLEFMELTNTETTQRQFVSDFAKQISSLSALAALAKAKFIEHYSNDAGGKGTIQMIRCGDPKENLAEECAAALYIFSKDIADKIKTTPGGPFHSLVATVFQFATGESADDDGNSIDAGLRKGVGAFRKSWLQIGWE